MKFEHFNQFSENDLEDSVNFREVLEKYLIHYKWFLVSIFSLLMLSFFYLRYEMPKFEVSSTILIKDKDKGSSLDQLGAFEDLGIFSSNNNSLENEIHILTSRRLMKRVVEDLQLNVKYFIESSPYDKEQFPDSPLILNMTDKNRQNFDFSGSFKILVKSSQRFEFFDSEDESMGVKEFGLPFNTQFGEIRVSLNDSWKDKLTNRTVIVKINRLDPVIDRYNNALQVQPIDDKSRVIGISIKETVKEKGLAVISNLIEQYNEDAVEDKNQVYFKTTEFLNDRIVLITSELNAIENTVEQFKTSKGLIDTKAGADIFLQSSSVNESQLIDANTQLQLIDYMIAELNRNTAFDPLPSNIGLAEQSIITLIAEFNNLVSQRNRILRSSTLKNPLVVNFDLQLKALKDNLSNSLVNMKSSLLIQINALNRQSGRIGSRIASVPKNEKEYTDIVRQQETKNAVYLFLLQKREESILSNAISINKARIVDTAYTNGYPVSPKPGVTYFAAFLLGVLIPACVIFAKEALDTKIHSEKDIAKLKIPYLGDIPLSASKKNLYISGNDNSNIAESFRYLRTNINFMLDSKQMGKTVFVTSTQSHEGKTFTAINLASSLAISGKKTILLALDLRAPKIEKYLNIEAKPGVTNFIKNNNLEVNEITNKHPKIKDLSLMYSGSIPPNPVELLMSSRVSTLFAHLKENFEYIIVDTAPVGMVTDTIQIGKHADLTIYVMKANYLDKRKLHIPDKLNKEKKLHNMAILINGSDHSKGAYGYGYGYGYGNDTDKPWYSIFMKKQQSNKL
jgi:capsular exopolysaccharide synthesis family protein